ncbi:helix-turn-helix domain-containing protein [Dyadobacter sp. OTU695]|uniref:helix-turn-helix domain-containing protein n=1 Tax=Dyadobacter sp. OTU695 TaxID=3043860 RepID=UPI00313B890A
MQDRHQDYCEHRIHAPAEFAGVITYFYWALNGTGDDINKILVPSFQTIMVFSFGSPVRFKAGADSLPLDQCLVLGPIKRPVEYTLPAGADLLVINFKDDAFYRFFGPALMSGMIAAHPDQLLQQNCFTQLWLSLKDETLEMRTELILDFCRPYLKCREVSFQDISKEASNYRVINPVKAVAQKTGQSLRNVQLNHKKYLGYTAKERGRYERFLKAMLLLQNQAAKVDWLEVVEACGYYDQSQLIHDFKHYLGLSPGRYVKFQAEVCRVDV